MIMRKQFALCCAVLAVASIPSASAVELSDLVGSWQLEGPLATGVRRIHGERLAADGVMTFNEDGTCLLQITDQTAQLPNAGAEGCSSGLCLPCTFVLGPERRFDLNWDDSAADSIANALAADLLGEMSEGASVDLEIERSAGIYRPVLNRIRVNTALKGVTTIPGTGQTRRFALIFSLAGSRPQ
jgi:hypothetical protein